MTTLAYLLSSPDPRCNNHPLLVSFFFQVKGINDGTGLSGVLQGHGGEKQAMSDDCHNAGLRMRTPEESLMPVMASALSNQS